MSSSTSDTESFPSAPAASTTVIVCGSSWNGNSNTAVSGLTSVTDNQGNTYSIIAQGKKGSTAGFSVCTFIAACENVSSSGTFTITVNFNGSGGNHWAEWSASSWTSTTVVDVSGANSGLGIASGSQPTVSTSGPTTAASEIVIAVASSSETSSPVSDVGWNVPSGWTRLSTHASQSDTVAHDCAYHSVGSTGTQTATWDTHLSQGGGEWSAAIVTLKAGGGGGGAKPFYIYQMMGG